MTLKQGVPTVSTFPPPTPPITYFGGLFTGRVEVSDTKIHVHRNLWFDRDIDGSWTIVAMLPEDAYAKGGYPNDAPSGGILVTDPVIQAFMEQLALLMADPEAFGVNETIGPKPTPRALDTA
jgi:hypothetical protein